MTSGDVFSTGEVTVWLHRAVSRHFCLLVSLFYGLYFSLMRTK